MIVVRNENKVPSCELAKLTLRIIGLVTLQSCAVLGTNPEQVSSPEIYSEPDQTTSELSSNNLEEIPVISIVDSVGSQSIIDEINRDGQSFTYSGFSEPVPTPLNVDEPDIVELNYEQADLRLVLEQLADTLDISILIDPSIDNRISIRTSPERPLQRDDIWPLIRLLTRDAGVFLERVGDVYNARRINSEIPPDIVGPNSVTDEGRAEVMQVTPLAYVSADTAVQTLEPFLAPEGSVSQLGARDLLMITASDFLLQRANELLTLIDADPFSNQGIHLYRLSNANASEVADELTEILSLIEGASPSYQVRGIERINALLVTAPAARGFEEITRWVQILDADSQEQVEQLFMYKVKNLDAIELAETLSTVFEEDDDVFSPPDVARAEPSSISSALAGEADQAVSIETEQSPPNITGGSTTAAVSANLTVKIVADEATNSLLIRSTARDYRQLLTTISQLDVVPLQVMVNAVIAQITLTDDTRFGVDWSRVAGNTLNPISSNTMTDFAPNLNGLMFTRSFIDGSARVDATLEAIAQNNEVQLLARPSLTVGNNQEGEIQIGAEVPVEAGESISAGGLSTTNIQYRDTGIGLLITPQINEDGVVNLIINQTLRSVDNSASGINNNPVFNNQEITTTVVVKNGENIVLGGLIQTDTEALNTGVPLLNRVPGLGNLFSYQQDNLERRELFIVLRPEIIDLNDQAGSQYSDILDRFELASGLFEEANI